jgi:membrane-associated protein
MDFLNDAFDIFLHLDQHVAQWADALGVWLYVLLFAIIFCETGLVVTPFLPGDSLLFAVGAVAALDGSGLNIVLLAVLLIAAGVLGDAVNYAIGHWLGPKVFHYENSWLLNKKHLLRAHRFYERHGGKTIVLARFIPIIRTFAPFVAGIGAMQYRRFAFFNLIGAVAWVLIFLLAGYFMGNIPAVKRNFQIIILAIIVISVLPVVIEFIRARREGKSEKTAVTTEPEKRE